MLNYVIRRILYAIPLVMGVNLITFTLFFGVTSPRQMAVQFNDEELQQFHDVKAAFDPAGILNPGKGVPALRFCQEYRSLEHKQHTHEHTEAAHG